MVIPWRNRRPLFGNKLLKNKTNSIYLPTLVVNFQPFRCKGVNVYKYCMYSLFTGLYDMYLQPIALKTLVGNQHVENT